MSGSITREGPGRWRLWISAGKDESGKRVRFSKRLAGTKSEARFALRAWLNEYDRGEVVKPSGLTLEQFVELHWLPERAGMVRPSTLESYARSFKSYLRASLGSLKLSELTADQIQAHLNLLLTEGGRSDAPLSPATVLKTQNVLKAVLDSAVDRGLIGKNPAARIPRPRPQRHEIRILQPWQVDEMLGYLGDRYPWAELPTRLAIYTGLRRGEVLGLRWGDIDLVGNTLSVRRTYHRMDDLSSHVTPPKSARSNRAVALTESTVRALGEHRFEAASRARQTGKPLSEDMYVFEWIDGEPIRPDSLSQAFRRSAEACGLKGVRFHDTRHTHASLMLKAGVHPKIVSERLGHSSIAFTLDTYSHVLPGLQEAAAASFEAVLNGQNPAPTHGGSEGEINDIERVQTPAAISRF